MIKLKTTHSVAPPAWPPVLCSSHWSQSSATVTTYKVLQHSFFCMHGWKCQPAHFVLLVVRGQLFSHFLFFILRSNMSTSSTLFFEFQDSLTSFRLVQLLFAIFDTVSPHPHPGFWEAISLSVPPPLRNNLPPPPPPFFFQQTIFVCCVFVCLRHTDPNSDYYILNQIKVSICEKWSR